MRKGGFLTRFIFNKNTVTLICFVLIIGVLYWGYNYRINQKVRLVSVPYATKNIDPRTQITDDMLGTVSVPASMLNGNILTDKKQIVDKYAKYNTMIPSGSLFYKSAVAEREDMPDAAWDDVPSCYTVVSLSINTDMAMGNSIYPGNYIDLYYEGTDSEGKFIYVNFITNIQVLAVKDRSGNNVFDKSEQLADTAYLLFAVPEYVHLLITRTQHMGGKIVAVQVSGKSDASFLKMTINSYIEDMVNSRSVILDDQPTSLNDPRFTCDIEEED